MIRFWRLFFVVVLLAVTSLTAYSQTAGSDELRLRDGTVVRGEAIAHDQTTVVFRTASGLKTYARRDVVSIVFGGVATTGGIPTGISAGPGLRVKRWYTWRKILDNPRDATAKHIFNAKISGNGQKIVFCGRQGVHTLNPDGSGLTQLTAEQTARCDITSDGRRVIWHNEKEGIVVAGADGSGRTALPGGLKPIALRISGDGSAVFVLDYEKDGIFRLTPDGSDIKRVVSTANVSAANGVSENRNHWRADSLDVSDDGRRLVFRFLWDAFALDVAGARLRQITRYLTPEDRNLVTARISPDGSKIAYLYYGSPEKHFAAVQEWNGASIATHNALGPGMSDMDVLSDGSVFGGGQFVRFLRRDGVTREEIYGFAEAPMMFDNPHGATSSADGRRAVLLTDGVVSQDQGRGTQIYVIEATPSSIAGFPTLQEIRTRPAFLLVDGSTTTTISARAGTPSQLNLVYAFMTRENLLGYDLNLARYYGDGWLVDDGMRGDTAAKDGIYTGNQFKVHQYVTRPIEPGPLTLRVFARTKSGSMTVVDLEGMEGRRP
jgi:hypothetical protein